jgi:hypothetical protein
LYIVYGKYFTSNLNGNEVKDVMPSTIDISEPLPQGKELIKEAEEAIEDIDTFRNHMTKYMPIEYAENFRGLLQRLTEALKEQQQVIDSQELV